jgi:hypothetical protein
METEHSIFHCGNMNFKARNSLFISEDSYILSHRSTWKLLAKLNTSKTADYKIEIILHCLFSRNYVTVY